jgi:hypothetical protein
MRSPRVTFSPAAAQTLMRRAIKPAMRRRPTFLVAVAEGDETQQRVLVVRAAIGAGGADEFALGVFVVNHLPGHRRALDVDIEDGEEDGNALAGPAHEVGFRRLVDDVDLALAGSDDGVRVGGIRPDPDRGRSRG